MGERGREARKEGSKEGRKVTQLFLRQHLTNAQGTEINRKPSPSDLRGILQSSFSDVPFHRWQKFSVSTWKCHQQRKYWCKAIKELHINYYLEGFCVCSAYANLWGEMTESITTFEQTYFWGAIFLLKSLSFYSVFSKTHIDVPTSNVFTFLITACPNISCQQCQKAAHYNDREED